jgi:hypothetical protein
MKVLHLYPKVVISAVYNTILFQQNLKMIISAGGGVTSRWSLSEISALPFSSKPAYIRIENNRINLFYLKRI